MSSVEWDPEIMEEFLNEGHDLLAKCEEALVEFSSSGEAKHFENYGLYIDRMMGTAATLNFTCLAELTKQGKEISYKASQVQDIEKLLAVSSLLSQLLKETEKSMSRLKNNDLAMTPEVELLLVKLKKGNQGLGNLRATVKS